MNLDDRAATVRFLVRDRAGQFTTVRRRPGRRRDRHREDPTTLSAHELLRRTLVLTARTEHTDRTLIVGERHLRTVLAHYSTHNKGRRPH
jgi:hypothetical protein